MIILIDFRYKLLLHINGPAKYIFPYKQFRNIYMYFSIGVIDFSMSAFELLKGIWMINTVCVWVFKKS